MPASDSGANGGAALSKPAANRVEGPPAAAIGRGSNSGQAGSGVFPSRSGCRRPGVEPLRTWFDSRNAVSSRPSRPAAGRASCDPQFRSCPCRIVQLTLAEGCDSRDRHCRQPSRSDCGGSVHLSGRGRGCRRCFDSDRNLFEPGLTPGTPARAAHPDLQQDERRVTHSSGAAHAVLFSLLLLKAATAATDIAVNHLALTVAGVFIYLAVAVAVVVALIHQNRTDIGRFLRWHVPASLGYVCAHFLLSAAYNAAAGLSGKSTDSYWRSLVALSETSAWESPWLMGMSVFSIAVSLAIAIPGWLGLARFWALRPSGAKGA